MVNYPTRRSNVNISEQLHRRSYVLNRNNQLGWDVFRVLFTGNNQSHYTFRRSCEMDIRVRRSLHTCHTLEVDSRPVSIVHNYEYHRTGNIIIEILNNASDPHSNITMYLAPRINLKRFMFSIFAIEESKQRLVAQINEILRSSSRSPTSDTDTFMVDIIEETNEKEIELALILCIMFDEMRDYTTYDEDERDDFSNIT